MNRVGFYIDATAEEFVEWLKGWAHGLQNTSLHTGAGQVVFGMAQRRTVLNQHLVVEIPAILASVPDVPDVSLVPIHLHVLPIGSGKSIEVIGTSEMPELMPPLIQIATAISDRWPMAGATMWFGQPRCSATDLCSLRIRTNLSTLRRELSKFTSSYSSSEIRSATLLTNSSSLLLHPQTTQQSRWQRWQIRLWLHNNSSWHGVDGISLDCEVSRTPGKYPLLLVLRCTGQRYREINPFVQALERHFRFLWDVMQADSVTKSDQGRSETASEAYPDDPWEVITDFEWDRRALRLWWMNRSCAEIGHELSVSPKTIRNRLCELRKVHGTSIVPMGPQRRKGKDKVGTPG